MKVIGCSIFRKEIEHLRGKDLAAIWLPAGLHVSDKRLAAALGQALAGEEEVACFYGVCHPDMNVFLASHGGRRLQAKTCVEAFLDPLELALLGERVFVMTPGWLREWQSIFIEGLGWDEIDGRINFGGYDKIVVLDFGLEPIDELAVLEFYDYTQTPVEIVPASLTWFRARVEELLGEE